MNYPANLGQIPTHNYNTRFQARQRQAALDTEGLNSLVAHYQALDSKPTRLTQGLVCARDFLASAYRVAKTAAKVAAALGAVGLVASNLKTDLKPEFLVAAEAFDDKHLQLGPRFQAGFKSLVAGAEALTNHIAGKKEEASAAVDSLKAQAAKIVSISDEALEEYKAGNNTCLQSVFSNGTAEKLVAVINSPFELAQNIRGYFQSTPEKTDPPVNEEKTDPPVNEEKTDPPVNEEKSSFFY